MDILPATSRRGFGLGCQNGRSSDFRLNEVFPWARESRPRPGQRPPHQLGRSAAGAPRARTYLSTPSSPPPGGGGWSRAAVPLPPLWLTSGLQALRDWLRLSASPLSLYDWLRHARDASPDWVDQSACAAGFSVASHSWGGLPADRTSRLSLEERSRLSGKAAAAAK